VSGRLSIHEIRVPFRVPLATADDTIVERSSVLIMVEVDGVVGWGEAPAFPSGRFGTAAAAFEELAAPSQWGPSGPTTPIARAGFEAAVADQAARTSGIPLFQWLGGSGTPVIARHPIGRIEVEQVEEHALAIEAHGITAVKVKVGPGRDIEPIRALRDARPDLDIGVDANAAYSDPRDPVFTALDRCGVSFIEQPFARGDLAAHRILRSITAMQVCLDESIESESDVAEVLAAEATDELAIKLNRHGLNGFQRMIRIAADNGIGVRIGGTFDTAVGRLHLLAAAGLPGIVDAAVGPPSAYLASDVAEYPVLHNGTVTASTGAGIGVDPSHGAIEALQVRALTVDLPTDTPPATARW
jgi:o-succinylbenzoate synthase